MYVKFSPRDLNPDFCPSHPTSTYYCKVTIAPKCVVVKNEKKNIYYKLNEYNCVHFLKTVYIEYIELSKIFEKCVR